jgi:hypothetical protein
MIHPVQEKGQRVSVVSMTGRRNQECRHSSFPSFSTLSTSTLLAGFFSPEFRRWPPQALTWRKKLSVPQSIAHHGISLCISYNCGPKCYHVILKSSPSLSSPGAHLHPAHCYSLGAADRWAPISANSPSLPALPTRSSIFSWHSPLFQSGNTPQCGRAYIMAPKATLFFSPTPPSLLNLSP